MYQHPLAYRVVDQDTGEIVASAWITVDLLTATAHEQTILDHVLMNSDALVGSVQDYYFHWNWVDMPRSEGKTFVIDSDGIIRST